jgi:RNase adaptor protein for sRNA GlmZ degradation
VWQARARYTPEAVEKMIDAYLDSLKRYRTVDKATFMEQLLYFRLFRLLQNLGAYGFRGLLERKKKFIESIPPAMQQIAEVMQQLKDEFPTLATLLQQAAGLPILNKQEYEGLTVDVMSFSYKRGIPDDYSGNGGGFVFDCRALHNPGRYEPYKKLCGYDEPVIRFLEEESRIGEFLDNVYQIVDMMVANYKERGFKHIQICFGCTGGQHRSVYSAEHTARHIAEKHKVKVVVTHIMQNKKYTIE